MDHLFLEVLNLSFVGSFAILALMIGRFLLQKFPRKYTYVLWAVVLVRLLVPISWESDVSLLPTTSRPIPQDIVYEATPKIHSGIPVIDDAVNEILPPVTHPEVSVNPIQLWIFAGRLLWCAGMIVLLSYGLFQYIRLKRKLSTAIPLENSIYLADNIPTPFVMGLLSPKIYLPSHLEAAEQDYIIAHEGCHLKRFDHVTRLVAFLTLTIHWFNPLVWLAFRLSERDMELSCDEAVMAKFPGDIRPDYATSLLRLASRGRFISPLAFGEGNTKGRVKNVMAYKKPVFWVTLVAILLAVSLGVSLLFSEKAQPATVPTESNAQDGISKLTDALSALQEGDAVCLSLNEGTSYKDCWNTWNSHNYHRMAQDKFTWVATDHTLDDFAGTMVYLTTDQWTLMVPETGNLVGFVSPEGTWVLEHQATDPNNMTDFPMYRDLRYWYDEVEYLTLGGDSPETIKTPDRGQGQLAVAEELVDAYEGVHLQVSPGSKFCYRFLSTKVTIEEDATKHFQNMGEIDKNTYCIRWSIQFVPENDDARWASIAGNTIEYTGTDPIVPTGALEAYRVGYVTLEDDTYHLSGGGTGW